MLVNISSIIQSETTAHVLDQSLQVLFFLPFLFVSFVSDFSNEGVWTSKLCWDFKSKNLLMECFMFSDTRIFEGNCLVCTCKCPAFFLLNIIKTKGSDKRYKIKWKTYSQIREEAHSLGTGLQQVLYFFYSSFFL